MAELGSGGGSDYPGTLDTNNTLEVNSPNAGKTKARAEVPNDHAAALVAIQTELGTDPAGTLTDVKTFLQAEHNTDGTHGNITAGTIEATSIDLGSSTVVSSTLDEDNMASNSATALATQQSIKAYADSVGVTNGDSHDHIGGDGAAITAGAIGSDAIVQSHISSGAVGQGELKTSSGEVSTAPSTPANLTLPGGAYGFYPQIKTSGAAVSSATIATTLTLGTSYVTNIYLTCVASTMFATQRYIAACAPYNLGNGDIPLFVFAVVNSNGDVESTYAADTPPWMYNGRPENTFDASKYKKKKDKDNFFYDKRLPLPSKETDFAGYLEAINNPQYEEIEITPVMKNLDMDIVPHPFIGNDLTDKSVVLLDPVGNMAEKMRSLHDMGESVADLLHGRYLLIDSEDIGAISPIGVETHKVKWKDT